MVIKDIDGGWEWYGYRGTNQDIGILSWCKAHNFALESKSPPTQLKTGHTSYTVIDDDGDRTILWILFTHRPNIKKRIPVDIKKPSKFWVECDGGRADAGYKGTAGDCVTRAIAIATGKNYKEVYDYMATMQQPINGTASARNGVFQQVYAPYLKKCGYKMTTEPEGTMFTVDYITRNPDCILEVRGRGGHLVCVRDGKIYDTYNCLQKKLRVVTKFVKK